MTLTTEQKTKLIAESQGWTPHVKGGSVQFYHPSGQSDARRKEFTLTVPIPDYFSDPGAAFTLVAALRKENWWCSLANIHEGWRCVFTRGSSEAHEVDAPTPAAAIAECYGLALNLWK